MSSRVQTSFAELCVATNFSFLRGASHAEELVHEAARLGLAGVGICDRNTLAGVVRAHVAGRDLGFPLAIGCRLAFRRAYPREDLRSDPGGMPDVLAWPTDRASYGRLTRLLTIGNRRAEKGDCLLGLADLLEWGTGMMLGVMPEANDTMLASALPALRDAFQDNVRLMASVGYGASDHRRLAKLAHIARAAGVPLMATNDVLYHAPERRPLQDVLTCIREKTTLAAAGHRLAANA